MRSPFYRKYGKVDLDLDLNLGLGKDFDVGEFCCGLEMDKLYNFEWISKSPRFKPILIINCYISQNKFTYIYQLSIHIPLKNPITLDI
jgi:hypothetical protein